VSKRQQSNFASGTAQVAAPLFIFKLEVFAMKSRHGSQSVLSALVLLSALGLSACAGMAAQERGTAAGAVIGGVAGEVLCGGMLCTAAGAAVGGVIGHEVTKQK
jgi:osmotically inducible lipoprotein OsmB